MKKHRDLDNPVKFKPDYKWPKRRHKEKLSKIMSLQLQENVEEYYGKPWWCHHCQWQFTEEDLKSTIFKLAYVNRCINS